MTRRIGSIRDRILWPFVALTAALVLVTGLASGHLAAERASEQVLERGRGIAETLRRSRFPLTPGVLQQLKGLGGAEFALVGADGTLGASTLDSLAAPAGSSARARLAELATRRPPELGDAARWSDAGAAYRVAVIERPGPGPTGPDGRLLLLLPESALEAAAWEARRAALALSVVGAILAAALASWLGRTLTEPLGAILTAIRQIGRGEPLARPLPTGRLDEIGTLAADVARLGDRLAALEREREQTARLRLIHQLSAGLAHELRNPLTAARMTIQLYGERNADRDVEPLRLALAELGRVERQVGRFLQISRPDPPRCRATPLGPLLAHALASHAAMAVHQGTHLDLDASASADLAAWADAEQIGQVLANLVRNAIEAGGPGGYVRLGASAIAPGRVALDVLDDGPGPAAGASDRLFEPFVTTKPEGVGLGLAVCAALVREHGGTIGWDRLDGWTRFRVQLPAPGAAGALLTGTAAAVQNGDGPSRRPD